MTDVFSKKKRSEIMSKVRSKNTGLELEVRKALWRRGVRYRIHDRSLPGTPDISLKGLRIAVFLDGCFWHGCPVHRELPATNTAFWKSKIERNIGRRRTVKRELRKLDFQVIEFYECEVSNNLDAVIDKIISRIKRP